MIPSEIKEIISVALRMVYLEEIALSIQYKHATPTHLKYAKDCQDALTWLEQQEVTHDK